MEKNTTFKRIIAIGDPHGCLDELQELLVKVEYRPENDRVIIVGDLVDRGPNTSGVVRFVREMNFECVMGNHDYKFIRYRKWERDMADETIKRRQSPQLSEQKLNDYRSLSEDDLEWISNLPFYLYEEPMDTLFCHAGVRPGSTPLRQKPQVYLFCRYVDQVSGKLLTLGKDFSAPEGSVHWTRLYNHPTNVVYGHHTHSLGHPFVNKPSPSSGWVFGIDTGCCFGGRLTAVTFDKPTIHSATYVQVPARKVYYIPTNS